jgi:uncharacterized protein YeaO (DUF488 family)
VNRAAIGLSFKVKNLRKINMKNGAGSIRLKRVYDSPAAEDGFRVLVERLWPRGITKAEAHLDLWMREIAPSSDLRKWQGIFIHTLENLKKMGVEQKII